MPGLRPKPGTTSVTQSSSEVLALSAAWWRHKRQLMQSGSLVAVQEEFL
jgi:hypothetical protein